MPHDFSRRTMLKTSLVGSCLAYGATLAHAAPAAKKIAPDYQYDAIIVGAGPAGLIAAITAHDQGAKVAVFEKRDRPDGNAIYALGSICGWGSRHQKAQGIKDEAEAFYAMMMDISKGKGDPQLNRCYTDHISEGIDWLERDIGVKFGKIRPMPYPRLSRTCRVDGQGITGGSQLVQKLLAACEKRGIPIFYEAKVVELIRDDSYGVSGIVALTQEGTRPYVARGGVCLATGGFSANPEMVTKYIGGWAAQMVLRGSHSTTGENITLAKPLFAKFVNMDQFHCGPIVAQTHVNPADVLNSGFGIQVNSEGQRYMDENNTYVIKARTTAQHTLDNQAWVIVDSQCPVLAKVIEKFDRLNSPYGKADSIEALAKAVKLPVPPVVREVARYNEAVGQGTLSKLTPPNTYLKPHRIEKGPFYAIPFNGGMTATFGGPLINVKAEVQNLDGYSIAGLYAAGNAAGGIFYHNYAGGAQLGAATVFGRIAGVEMAQRAKRRANV